MSAHFIGTPDVKLVLGDDAKSYYEFLQSLQPNYLTAQLTITTYLIGVIAITWLYASFSDNFLVQALFLLPTAILVGILLHGYGLFMHEAAHYNLTKSRYWNDKIANILFLPVSGQFIKNYRKSHWKHHTCLGTDNDTEISYASPLGIKNIIIAGSGLYLIVTGIRYYSNFKKIGASQSSLSFAFGIFVMLTLNLLVFFLLASHFSILTGLLWLISQFIVSPLISKIRQTLEHRRCQDDFNSENYSENIRATNRIFQDDLLSRVIGAAGFNKHLLHHMAPQVSYTNFKKFEEYVRRTSLAGYIESRSFNYFEVFRDLCNE